MAVWTTLLPLVPAAVMVVGDFRRREVGLLWMLLFIVSAAGVAVGRYGWGGAVANAAFNLLLMLYMAGGVIFYLRIRDKKWINPLEHHFGAGDLLFILGMAPLFGLRVYLSLLLVSMAAGLLWWAGVRLLLRRHLTVPLVGVMGIVLGGYLVYYV